MLGLGLLGGLGGGLAGQMFGGMPNSINNITGAFDGPTPLLGLNAITGMLPGLGGVLAGGGLFGRVNDMLNPPNKENPNTVLNAMTPKVAGVFQGMGVNPQGFAKQAVAENDEDDNSLLTQIALQGLLNQPDPQPIAPANIQGAFMRGQQMPMQSINRFYEGLL